MNVGREIAARMAEQEAAIEAERVEEELTARYRRAREIMRTIPSGTRNVDLTPEQAAAVNEWEAVLEARAALREES